MICTAHDNRITPSSDVIRLLCAIFCVFFRPRRYKQYEENAAFVPFCSLHKEVPANYLQICILISVSVNPESFINSGKQQAFLINKGLLQNRFLKNKAKDKVSENCHKWHFSLTFFI